MDRDKMQAGIQEFLDGLGERFKGDDLDRTPARVARAWCEDLVSGYGRDALAELTWSAVDPGVGPVVVRRIRFASVCVHHLLPFFGFVDVDYLPDRRLAGLSKIGRVVDVHTRRLQTQERLGAEIVATLARGLEPRGVMARLAAEHTCMTLRGVRKEDSLMATLASSGIYDTDAEARREILELMRGGAGTPAPE